MKSLAILIGIAACACSSATNVPVSDAATVPDAPANDAGTDAPGLPKAPSIKTITPMSSVLMVSWTNNDATCQSVEGERKSSTEAYKVVFSVAGTVATKMDGTAKGNVDYTYRLRCLRDGVASEYSAEMTANPTK